MMKFIVDFALQARNSLNKRPTRDFVEPLEMGERIPRIIHQTFSVGPNSPDFPPELQRRNEKVKTENPNWEIRFYDDEEIARYIGENFPKLKSYYDRIDSRYGAARADFFRYLVMYREGGVYLDVKSGTAAPLDDIIRPEDKYILSHWPRSWPPVMQGKHPGITNPIGELQQWHIIAVPGHPFLRAVINNVCNNIDHYNPVFHDVGSWGVFNLTGPIAYTEAIYPLLSKYPHRLEQDHIEIGLTYYALETDATPAGEDTPSSGHHRVFGRKHYSKLQVPIVRMPLHIKLMYYVSKPIAWSLKKMHRLQKGRA